MKRKVESSWLFRSCDLFYPNGAPASADQYAALSIAAQRTLESDLQQMLTGVVTMYIRSLEPLSRYFGRALPAAAPARIILTDKREPIAKSFLDERGRLEIDMDARILQANFRATLVQGLQEKDKFFMDTAPKTNERPQSDIELIAGFIAFKRDLRKAPAGNMLGDLFGGLGDEDNPKPGSSKGRWFNMVDLAMRADRIQAGYTGTLLFLIGHEMGHYALGHYDHACDAPACVDFQANETEADRFSAYLIARFLAPSAVFGMGDLSGAERLSGFQTFFEQSYSRIGFVEAKNSACQCPYPQPEERLKLANAALEHAYDEYNEAFGKALDDALNKAADSAAKKPKRKTDKEK